MEVLGRESEGSWHSLARVTTPADDDEGAWFEDLGVIAGFEELSFVVRTLGLGSVERTLRPSQILRRTPRGRIEGARAIVLALPECAFLRVDCGGAATGDVVWFSPAEDERAEVVLERGVAALPVRVGMGECPFQIQPRRRAPFAVEHLTAPSRPFGIAERRYESVDSCFAKFRGRLGVLGVEPLVRAPVEVRSVNESSREFRASVRTDAEGRCELPQWEPLDGRWYELRVAANSDEGRSHDLYAYLRVTTPERDEDEQLGDVLLLPAAPRAELRLLADEDLRRLLEQVPSEDDSSAPAATNRRHSLLLEMARRGDAFLPVLRDLPWSWTRDVLLARARGDPDPYALEPLGLDAKRRLEFVFPDRGVVEARLRNLSGDEEPRSWSLGIPFQCSLTRENGERVARTPVSVGGSGLLLEFPVGSTIPLATRLSFTYGDLRPGTYRAKLVLTPDVELVGELDLDGVVAVQSESFEIRLSPLRIRLHSAEIAQWNEWLDALDGSEPPVLCFERWRPDLRFLGEATSAEDRVFREGLRIVPVLIDRLERETDQGRADRLCALLTCITGLHPPSGVLEGRFQEVGRWPSVAVEEGDADESAGFEEWSESFSTRADAVRLWTAERVFLDVVVEH